MELGLGPQQNFDLSSIFKTKICNMKINVSSSNKLTQNIKLA